MVQLEEISDEVAKRLQISQEKSREAEQQQQQEKPGTTTESKTETQNNNEAAAAAAPVAAGPRRPGEDEPKKSVDEWVAELKKSPFFMTELEENDETEALKALAYEGSPLENALGFKKQGNDYFRWKRWTDAKEFYTKGILILAAEERKRRESAAGDGDAAAAAAAAAAGGEGGGGGGGGGGMEPDPDVGDGNDVAATIREQRSTLETLYVNRAACHLELRNHRSAYLDGSAALRLNRGNVKAYYRSARAFLAVDRLDEAEEACEAGLLVDAGNQSLRGVAGEIARRRGQVRERAEREARRIETERRREALVGAALAARGIRTRRTERPPDMEPGSGVRMEPDPDDAASELTFPAVLLYPAHLESDFVKGFGETSCLADHLEYILPLPWDEAGEYRAEGVECYMETAAGGLVKVGRKVPLLKMLAGGKVEVVDELVRIYVLPKARAEGWVKEFKERKALEQGRGR